MTGMITAVAIVVSQDAGQRRTQIKDKLNLMNSQLLPKHLKHILKRMINNNFMILYF